jgi:hypothetical protein
MSSRTWLQRSSAQTAFEQFNGEISSVLVYTVIFLLSAHVLTTNMAKWI